MGPVSLIEGENAGRWESLGGDNSFGGGGARRGVSRCRGGRGGHFPRACWGSRPNRPVKWGARGRALFGGFEIFPCSMGSQKKHRPKGGGKRAEHSSVTMLY